MERFCSLDKSKPTRRFRGWDQSPYEEEEIEVVERKKKRRRTRVKNERTLEDAIIIVLKSREKSMNPQQIWCEIERRGLYTTTGSTPWRSVSSSITQNIKRFGKNSKYIRTKPGYYKIRPK
jgi:hypothetical protein